MYERQIGETEGRDQLHLHSKISHMSDRLLLLLLWANIFFNVEGIMQMQPALQTFPSLRSKVTVAKTRLARFASRITDDAVVSSQLENGFKFAHLFEASHTAK